MAELEESRAGRGRTDDTFDRRALEHSHEELRALIQTGDPQRYHEINEAFHATIYTGAHNAYLAEITLATRVRVQPFRRAQFRNRPPRKVAYGARPRRQGDFPRRPRRRRARHARSHPDGTRGVRRLCDLFGGDTGKMGDAGRRSRFPDARMPARSSGRHAQFTYFINRLCVNRCILPVAERPWGPFRSFPAKGEKPILAMKSDTRCRRGCRSAVSVHSGRAADFAGSVQGVVKSAAGQALPGAYVKLINPERRLTFMLVSQAQGRYTMNNLPPGNYTVQGSATASRASLHRWR